MAKTRMTSGVAHLDQLLEGLYLGDNVIWYDDAGSLAWLFGLNFLEASMAEDKPVIYVSFDRPPRTLLDRLGALAVYPNLIVLDCFTCGKGGSSPVFAKFYDQTPIGTTCRVLKVEQPKDMARVTEILYGVHSGLKGDVRLIFESLTGMQEIWGGEDQLISFYSHSCPRLYELEAIAYWIMEKKAHSARLKAHLSQLAQVVIDLAIKRGTTTLTILKADKRDFPLLQKPQAYWVRGGTITFGADKRATGGLELGFRLKDLRVRKGLSQTELARLVGVTPSTISQVESNLIYPSLPALLKMAEILTVDVGSLLRGQSSGRRQFVFSPEEAIETRLTAMKEDNGRARRLIPLDLDVKIEPYLIEINPGQSLPAHFFTHKGEEFGYLLGGRLETRLQGQTVAIEAGKFIYLTTETPSGWHNPGSEPASLLWFKIR
ncbi:MAG: helix-turn-helix domain-containing protein [Thermodesulfobacteriota bacterium]